MGKFFSGKRRGIILITSMLLLLVIFMVASIVTVTGRNTLQIGTTYAESEAAYSAALSGLEYVQYRMVLDKKWMTKDSEERTPPRFKNFVVEENFKQRWVVGCINADGPNKAYFRIAFCNDDVVNNSVGKDVTAPLAYSQTSIEPNDFINKGKITLPGFEGDTGTSSLPSFIDGRPIQYISCNGFTLGEDSTGLSFMKNSDGNYKPFRQIKKDNMHVIVEGICGRSVKHVESVLGFVATINTPACSMARRDIVVSDLFSNVGSFMVQSSSGAGSIRTVGNITVSSEGGRDDKDCFRIDGNGKAYAESVKVNDVNVGGVNNYKEEYGFEIAGGEGNVVENFLDDLNSKEGSKAKDTIDKRGGLEINPGHYAYIRTSGSGDYQLYKYTGAGGIEVLEKGVEFKDNFKEASIAAFPSTLNENYMRVDLRESISVDGDFSIFVADYNLVERDTDGDGNVDESVHMSKVSGNARLGLMFNNAYTPTLTSSGSLYVGGDLSGEGRVFAGGDVSFQGESLFEATPGAGVTVYSDEGDVNIMPAVGLTVNEEVDQALKTAWNNLVSQKAGEYEGSNSPQDGYVKTNLKSISTLNDTLLKMNAKGGEDLRTVLARYGLSEKDMLSLADMIISDNTTIGNDTSTSELKVDEAVAYDAPGLVADIPLSEYGVSINTGGTNYKLSKMEVNYNPAINDKKATTTVQFFNDKGEIACSVVLTHDNDGNMIDLKSNNGVTDGFVIKADGYTNFSVQNIANNSNLMVFSLGSAGSFGTNDYQLRIASNTISINNNNIQSDTVLMKNSSNMYMPGEKDTKLKGTIYTKKGSFIADLGNGSLNITGGILSNSDIIIKKGRSVTLYYDPSYLQFCIADGVITTPLFKAAF